MVRSAGSVHASSTCASIMMSTARARAQSRSTRRAVGPPSRTLLKCHLEVDVWPERVPHRAVLVARQRDGALDGADGHDATNDEVKTDAAKAMGAGLGTVALEVRSQIVHVMTSGRQDMDQIHAHASRQRGRQG